MNARIHPNRPSSSAAPTSATSLASIDASRPRLPKVAGADMEFANFLGAGIQRTQGTGFEASRLLLGAIDGVPSLGLRGRWGSSQSAPARTESDAGNPGDSSSLPEGSDCQDWGRKFLPNGGCAYVDLNHLELCIPEALSAYDHLAATHGMFRLAHQAAGRVGAQLGDGRTPVVLANNSDGLGNSYGTHLNFLISRRLWEDIFHHRLQFQLYLAAFQVSSIVITGLGKVGSENRQPPVPFQISQRADFCEILAGLHTTHERPIVNSREEALCGPVRYGGPPAVSPSGRARLHVIFYDNNLCHTAGLLKVAMLQLVLAAMEAGHMNPGLLLDNPLEALGAWSHDPDLQNRARLVSGQEVTAVELQCLFFEEIQRFAHTQLSDELVPRYRELLRLWGDTLVLLEKRDVSALARRLDWVLKRLILDQTIAAHSQLTWASPEIKWLDHLYSHVDPAQGLYWAYERAGLTDILVSPAHIQRLMQEAPPETRAWTRALLLRSADPADIEHIDWDELTFRLPAPPEAPYAWNRWHLSLPDPAGFGQTHIEPQLPESGSFQDLLEVVGAHPGYSWERSPSTGFNS